MCTKLFSGLLLIQIASAKREVADLEEQPSDEVAEYHHDHRAWTNQHANHLNVVNGLRIYGFLSGTSTNISRGHLHRHSQSRVALPSASLRQGAQSHNAVHEFRLGGLSAGLKYVSRFISFGGDPEEEEEEEPDNDDVDEEAEAQNLGIKDEPPDEDEEQTGKPTEGEGGSAEANQTQAEPSDPDEKDCGAPGEARLIKRPSGHKAVSQWICPHRDFNWHEERLKKLPKMECDKEHFAPGPGRCPKECGFEAHTNDWCYFACVPEEKCGELDKKSKNPSSIADKEQGVCRKCEVAACAKCLPKEDRCQTCKLGYLLNKETGQCDPASQYLMFVIIILALIVGSTIPPWYISLRRRPPINQKVLDVAVQTRGRMKVGPVSREYDVYPIFTNVHKYPIAGVGMLLQFDWQVMVIIWAGTVAVAWSIVGYFEPELLQNGTRDLGDNQQQVCMMLFLGVRNRRELGTVQTYFVGFLWVCTTIGFFLFSLKQRRRFAAIDSDTTSMMDFSVMVDGFPIEKGDKMLEDEYKAFFQKNAPDIEIIGVSIAWNFTQKNPEVAEATKRMSIEREYAHAKEVGDEDLIPLPPENSPEIPKYCHILDDILCAGKFAGPPTYELQGEEYDKSVQDLLHGLETTGMVVLVMGTEHARNQMKVKINSPDFPAYPGGEKLKAHAEVYEPESMFWENIGTPTSVLIKKAAIGLGWLAFAIFVWAFCFYQPYAHYVVSMYTDLGAPPGLITGIVISLLVVVGNVIMYAICYAIGASMGFSTQGNMETFYCVAYFFACIINMMMDVGTLTRSSYLEMIHQGFRAEDGRKLKEIANESILHLQETFPMQRAVGLQLKQYNFPACFLIPFVMEPIFTVWLPYHLGRLIARSRPVHLFDAREMVRPLPLDLSRYADLTINITLACMTFWFAPGYIRTSFVGLCGSNIFIYLYDRYRTLRCAERVNFASYKMELVTQQLLAVPCAVLASIFVKDIFEDPWMSLVGFGAHLVLHLSLLRLLPSFRKDEAHDSFLGKNFEDEESQDTFESCAKTLPGSWFSVNPVHCLRSKYIYRHSPPCQPYAVGKEHLLQMNKSIGCHYVAAAKMQEREAEDLEELERIKLTAQQTAGDLHHMASNPHIALHSLRSATTSFFTSGDDPADGETSKDAKEKAKSGEDHGDGSSTGEAPNDPPAKTENKPAEASTGEAPKPEEKPKEEVPAEGKQAAAE